MRKIFYFREFACAEGHKTYKLVEPDCKGVECETCGDIAVRPEVMAALSAAVHGDEIDYIDHNLGRDPVHIRSKAHRRALMAAAGLEEFIRHTPVPGTDRSPFTTDWSKGSMDPKTLENAAILVSRQAHREVALEPDLPVANPFSVTALPEEVRELADAAGIDLQEDTK